MRFLVAFLLRLLTSPFRSHFGLEVQVLVLRQQLAIYQRSVSRPRLCARDRLFWCWLSRQWSRWRQALYVVKPATVNAWRRRRFRDYWARLSAKRGPGRPPVAKEIQDLIRQMSKANVTWGSPRIRSELRMVGIEVAKSTIERYMVKRPKPVSPTWRAFLANHVPGLVSIDGDGFRGRARGMEINEVLIAPPSPWQSPYVERGIGSIRRDCLDHVVVLNERHLRRVLTSYLAYYHGTRCHMGLDGDAPEHREPQPPEMGTVVELPEVGGLHHRYERRAA